MVQKPSPIFWRTSLVFWRFFDPPKIPKKRPNTSSMKDFNENSLFSKLEILKMQKCSEMEARASFFKVAFKKHREGGVGGTASTPGSKLALATLPARHRRIEWAIARVPPTPPFGLWGGRKNKVSAGEACGRIMNFGCEGCLPCSLSKTNHVRCWWRCAVAPLAVWLGKISCVKDCLYSHALYVGCWDYMSVVAENVGSLGGLNVATQLRLRYSWGCGACAVLSGSSCFWWRWRGWQLSCRCEGRKFGMALLGG